MTVLDTFTATSGASTTPSATLTLSVPRAVAAGNTLILIAERVDFSGGAAGIVSISGSRGNPWNLDDAISLRSLTCEVSICSAQIVTPLQAGDSITVTWHNTPGRRNIIAHVVSGLLAPITVDATSGAAIPATNVNTGPNGSSTAPSGSTTAATTQAVDFVIAGVGYGSGGGTFTAGAGYTAGTSVVTSAGSSDRALATEYKTTSATGTQTAGGTLGASAGWCVAVAAYKTATAGNAAPTVNAGADQSNIEPNSTVVHTATGTDSDGTVVSYVWTQTAGPPVVLNIDPADPTGATFSYVAPLDNAGDTLTFSVTAFDDDGAASSPDTVTDTVNPAAEHILIGTTWTPAVWGIYLTAVSGGGGGGTGGALTLVVTPDTAFTPPRIRLDVTDTRDQPATSLVLSRRNPDGHTVPVRTADGGPLPLSGGAATIYDYEPPYDAPITFTVDDPAGAPVATELLVDDVWLVHPGVPSLSQKLKVTGLDQRTRETSRTLYQVLARDDPIPVSAGARPASAAVLTVRTYTEPQRAALDLLLADDTVLLLNIPAVKTWGWGPVYVSCGQLQEKRTVNYGPMPYREWTLPIQVVGRPGGGTQAAITWDDVVAAYPTWQAIEDAGITSWAELAAPTA